MARTRAPFSTTSATRTSPTPPATPSWPRVGSRTSGRTDPALERRSTLSSLLADAIALAAEAHRGQVDKAGEPYILHPLRVMFRIRDQGHRVEAQAAAVLHDVVEDTHVTLEDIAALCPEVAALVDAVTRRPGESYGTFVQRAGENPEARAVKVADLQDNLARLDRLAQVSPDLAERLGARYRRALAVLLEPPLRG